MVIRESAVETVVSTPLTSFLQLTLVVEGTAVTEQCNVTESLVFVVIEDIEVVVTIGAPTNHTCRNDNCQHLFYSM